MEVEVVYALPNEQTLIRIVLNAASTVQMVIEQSGILQQCPQLDLAQNKVGIFGRLVNLTDLVREGDRIEIYRPLIIEPMAARRLRAPKKLKKQRKRHSHLNANITSVS